MELSKLNIESYKDKGFNSKIGSYEVMLNPESYTHNYSIEYSKKQAPGRSDTSIKFHKATPQTLSFDLVFDGTGVVDPKRTGLISEIEKFRNVVYKYNGNIHKPNYLKLIWGKYTVFRCMLSSMSVNYKLFRPNGTPLRAIVKVTFTGYEDPTAIAKQEGRNSPDMSHVVTVVAGDTLPALTYEVYGEKQHYLKVARYNGLDNFRDLKPGMKLTFPPLV